MAFLRLAFLRHPILFPRSIFCVYLQVYTCTTYTSLQMKPGNYLIGSKVSRDLDQVAQTQPTFNMLVVSQGCP